MARYAVVEFFWRLVGLESPARAIQAISVKAKNAAGFLLLLQGKRCSFSSMENSKCIAKFGIRYAWIILR